MKVTLLQTDIVWQDPSANQKRLDDVFSSLQPTDLIVLPEMFSTGFVVEPEDVAEKDFSSLNWLKRKSKELNCAIAASVATEDKDGKYYNRFYFVKPDGNVEWYDKRHLFTFGGEDKHFTAGHRRVIVEWKGIRFLLLVCYDLRFPVWARNRKDYDAILIVASWPECRRLAWDTLLRARAIENQCYVLSVNRQGDDPKNHYNGGTFFIDPLANVTEAIRFTDFCSKLETEFDTMELETKLRPGFPVLDDADDFKIL